jgi:hypothetical protein
MTARTKGDLLIIAVLLAVAIYSVSSSVVVTGSGGLGAVSVSVLPALMLVGACALYALRRSTLSTRAQLILWAVWGAVGVFLIIFGA